jgi:hypothetical protein
MLQLLQLEEVQPEHEPAVPAMGVDSPLLLLENEANRDKIRLAVCWHCGHEASSSALFMERNSSNLQAHPLHRYSYIGISLSNNKV